MPNYLAHWQPAILDASIFDFLLKWLSGFPFILKTFSSFFFEGKVTFVYEVVTIPIAYPRLSRRGRQTQIGCANILFGYFFAENCMEMKGIGPGARL